MNFFNIFGFASLRDFCNSMFHTQLYNFIIPFAATFTVIERLLGIHRYTLFALILLLTLELITGMWASKIKGRKIASKKMSRFGLKLLVWFSLIFILKSLAADNVIGTESSSIYTNVFSYLHGFIIAYIVIEYAISVLENFKVISGKDNTVLIDTFRSVLRRQKTSIYSDADFLNDVKKIRLLLSLDGFIVKADDSFADLLGYEAERVSLLESNVFLQEESRTFLNEYIEAGEFKPVVKELVFVDSRNHYIVKPTNITYFEGNLFLSINI